MDARTSPRTRKRGARVATTIRLRALGVLLAAALVACLVAKIAVAEPPQTANYQVIVHPTNPALSLERTFVSQGFLKKITSWSHGGVIRPVDLPRESPVRRKFSEDALGRSVAAVKSYWQQMIFSGRGVPPPELPSDDDVIRYVLREPGAIGYVSTNAALKGARVVELR